MTRDSSKESSDSLMSFFCVDLTIRYHNHVTKYRARAFSARATNGQTRKGPDLTHLADMRWQP